MGACTCSSNTQTLVYEKYNFGQIITEGTTYRVVEGFDKNNGDKKLAIKIMSKKKRVSQSMYTREIDILSRIKHQNIIEYVDDIEDDINYYIITGLYEGGDLFDRIINPQYNITEMMAASFICDMLKTVKYLHENDIVHRNIKPENFVFHTNKNDDTNIILINFRSAGIVNDEKEYQDTNKILGTAHYMAPELVPRENRKKCISNNYKKTGKLLKCCDIWSIGVTAYVLLIGRLPFKGSTDSDVFNHIISDKLTFPSDMKLTDGFKDFIHKILVKDPYERITIDAALCHPWIKGISDTEIQLNNEIIGYLQQYNYQTKLKKAVTKRLVFLNAMNIEIKKKAKKHWNRLDWDGRGYLDIEDMKDLLLNMGYTANEASKEAKLMIDHGCNGHKNGRINYNQFKQLWQRKFICQDRKYIHSLFNVFDKNGNGYIDDKDIHRVLNVNNTQYIKQIIQEIDENNDGKLSFQQFEKAMLET